jgi:hypothetical protein
LGANLDAKIAEMRARMEGPNVAPGDTRVKYLPFTEELPPAIARRANSSIAFAGPACIG